MSWQSRLGLFACAVLAFLPLPAIPAAAEVPAGALQAPATSPQTSSAPALPPLDVAKEASQYRRLLLALTDDSMAGRGAGTAGIDHARDLIAREMKGIGLSPAVGNSYLQPFNAALGVQVKAQALAIVDEKDKVLYEAKPAEGFNTLGLSADGDFNMPAVFAGYGAVNPQHGYNSYADTESRPIRGRAVVVFRYEPMDEHGKSLWAKGRSGWSGASALSAKIQQAQKFGAGVLLIVDPPACPGPLLATRMGGMGGKAKIPVMHISQDFFKQMLRSASRKPEDITQLQQAADKGPSDLVELEGIQVRGGCRLQAVMGKLHNVAGVLGGSGDLEREVIVVGAHYDHLGVREAGATTSSAPTSGSSSSGSTTSSPTTATAPAGGREIFTGADDNASGTAGMLTLARWLAAEAPRHEPRRTIIFVAFSGEELGLLGSEYMLKNPDQLKLATGQVAAMLNFDMIGRLREGRLAVLGVDSGDQWRRIIASASLPEGMTLLLGSEGMGASDHASFYTRRIPVLHFYTGMTDDVHSPRDLPDKINSPGAVEVLDVARQVLLRIACDPQRMAFTGVKPRGQAATGPAKPFMGVALGTPPPRVKGCRIEDVNADSPADKAGLKTADVITAWDQAAVASVAEFFAKMDNAKPGQKVALTIIRDGKERTVEVTLGGR